MRCIKNKTALRIMSYLVFILVSAPLFSISAQNHVASGGELFSGSMGYDFQSSTVWSTDRSTTPGYYSWDGDSGNAYTGADDTHHVNGYVKKYGTKAFTFPIGTGADYRTLSIGSYPSGNNTDAYAAAWIVGDPSTTPDPTNANSFNLKASVSGVIVGVSPVGQWDWQAISGTGAGLSITVSMPEINATGAFIYPTNLRLVGWNGSNWINLGDVGASAFTRNSTLSGTMVAGIQAIGIGAVCNAGISYPIIK